MAISRKQALKTLKPVGARGARKVGRMPTSSKLEQLLAEVFDGMHSGLRKEVGRKEYERRRYDFDFHMTDWETDLRELVEIFDHPDKWTEESASPLIIGLLYHVIPHLKAAGRLLLDEIPDAFADLYNDPQVKTTRRKRRTA